MTFNDKVLFSMFFIFAVGICGGAFFEVYMEGDGKTQLMEFLSLLFDGGASAGFFQSLIRSLMSWIVMLLLPFASVYLPPLSIVCPLIPFAKGLTLGFSATMLVETFGLTGGWYIVSTLLPQSLIQIPVMCFLTALSLSMSRKNNRKALQMDARQYYLSYCAGGLLIFISCLLEAGLIKLVL